MSVNKSTKNDVKNQYKMNKKFKRNIDTESGLISGFLWIKMKLFFGYQWKMYWFVLTRKFELNYYRQYYSKQIKGSIDLIQPKIISVNVNKKCEYDKLCGSVQKKIKTYPFVLKLDDQIYIMRADNKCDRCQFVYYINNVIKYKQMLPIWSIIYVNHDINKIHKRVYKTKTQHCVENEPEYCGEVYLIDIYGATGLLKYTDGNEPSTYIQIAPIQV